MIYFALSFAVGLVGSIITVPVAMSGANQLILQGIGTQLGGFVIGWLMVAFAELYIELRRARDEDQDLLATTFR